MREMMSSKQDKTSTIIITKRKRKRQMSKHFIKSHRLYILAVINFKEVNLVFFYTLQPFSISTVLVNKENSDDILWRCSKPLFQTNETINPHNIFLLENDVCFQFSSKKKVSVEVFSLEDIFEQQPLTNVPIAFDRAVVNPILLPLKDSQWQSLAVFNCAALYLDGRIHFVYRAIGDLGLSNFGYASSSDGVRIDKRGLVPIFQNKQLLEMTTDFSNNSESSNSTATIVDHRPGINPEANISNQAMTSSYQYQSGINWGGYEDPRLSQVEDTIYMTYTAFDGVNPPGVALTSISTTDFLNENWCWREPVLISARHQAHKNWVIFPEKINGKFAIMHSLTPEVSIEYFDDLLFENEQVINSIYKSSGRERYWDNWMRGVGPPPIKTKDGWLVFYHAMDNNDPDRYKIGAMLLDLNEPTTINYRSNKPLLEPDARYENDGFKSGVVYSCGAVIIGEFVYLYYGGADTVVCAAFIKLDQLLEQLKHGETPALSQLLVTIKSNNQLSNNLTNQSAKRSTLCMV